MQLGGVGRFRGRSQEGMVQGAHEALRAHPHGGLCKGAQAAHPQARERGQDEVTERGGGYRELGDPTAIGVWMGREDHNPRGREEEVGVHLVKDLLEDVEVSVGREVHVGVAVRIVYSDLVGYQTLDIRLLWTTIAHHEPPSPKPLAYALHQPPPSPPSSYPHQNSSLEKAPPAGDPFIPPPTSGCLQAAPPPPGKKVPRKTQTPPSVGKKLQFPASHICCWHGKHNPPPPPALEKIAISCISHLLLTAAYVTTSI